MAKRISDRVYKTVTEYSRDFQFIGACRGTGFSLPCNADGSFDETVYASVAQRQAKVAELVADNKYEDHGVVAHERTVVEPAVIECDDCHRHVELHGFTNTCECGADYNMSGYQLAPREQWGEETGESAAEIMMADSDYDTCFEVGGEG